VPSDPALDLLAFRWRDGDSVCPNTAAGVSVKPMDLLGDVDPTTGASPTPDPIPDPLSPAGWVSLLFQSLEQLVQLDGRSQSPDGAAPIFNHSRGWWTMPQSLL